MGGRNAERLVLHVTKDDVEIAVSPGVKSQFDFRVSYRDRRLSNRFRTPRHVHWVIDLYLKREHEPRLVARFLEHLLGMTKRVEPLTSWPPGFQFFSGSGASRFASLDPYGEYSTEFLLAVIELIMIQERTNYPNGTMNARLLRSFLEGDDIFAVVSTATTNRGNFA